MTFAARSTLHAPHAELRTRANRTCGRVLLCCCAAVLCTTIASYSAKRRRLLTAICF